MPIQILGCNIETDINHALKLLINHFLKSLKIGSKTDYLGDTPGRLFHLSWSW